MTYWGGNWIIFDATHFTNGRATALAVGAPYMTECVELDMPVACLMQC